MKPINRSLAFPALLAVIFLSVPVLRAEPSIQRYFPNFEECRFVMTGEETSAPDAQPRGPFPLEFLEDARLASLSSWRMTDDRKASYDLQVWEVLDDLGAYELFTHWPRLAGLESPSRLEAPVGNWFSPDKAAFWRGNYFIQISRSGGTPLQPGEITALIGRFAAAVELANLLPVTASHLPKEGMAENSALFYLGAETLKTNSLFPEPLLADLGFSDRIEVAYALYGPERSPLFLIGYPTHELAREYSAKIRADLDGYFSSQALFLKRSGLLVAIFSGPDAQASEVLNQVSYSPSIQYFQKKSDEPKPSATKTFLGLVTKAILGTGTFIVFVLVLGFCAGVLRYYIILRFPKFAKRNDTIRLDLD